MQPSPEEFLLRPGEPHASRTGIVFTLEEGGHKHAMDGSTTGFYVLRYERGDLRGAMPFSASGPEDFYIEGYALGAFFQLAGSPPDGGVSVVLHPRTSRAPRAESEVNPEGACRDVLKKKDLISAAIPAGASLNAGVSARRRPGTCIISPINSPQTVVVVGIYSLEVLYVRVGPTEELPRLK